MARKGSRKRLNKRGGDGDAPAAPAPADPNFTGLLTAKINALQETGKGLLDEGKNTLIAQKEGLNKELGDLKSGITTGVTDNVSKLKDLFGQSTAPAGGRRRRSTKRKTAKRSSSKRSSSKRSRTKRSSSKRSRTTKRKRVRFSMRSRSKRRH